MNIRGPRGCYDESKRFGETLTVVYHREYDLDVRTARIFNTYSPRMRTDDERVIPNFRSQGLHDEDLTVYGDGSQTRSFCYVDDMVGGLRALMTTDGLAGEVGDLGNENEITIRTHAKTVLKICDTDSGLTHKPLPEDDPERRRSKLSQAREQSEYESTVELREGLKRTLDYFEAALARPTSAHESNAASRSGSTRRWSPAAVAR